MAVEAGVQHTEAKTLLREAMAILRDEHSYHHPSLTWPSCSTCEFIERAKAYV